MNEDVKELFARIDTNNSKTISYSEFLTASIGLEVLHHESLLENMFNVMSGG